MDKQNLWPFKNNSDCYAVQKLKVDLNSINFSWKLLPEMSKLLKTFVKMTNISPEAYISPTAMIDGPVIIEAGAKVQDYAKIVGPSYIGKNTIIGNFSLIRESFIGENCVIGYLVDIARSFLGNSCWLSRSHIADSILGNDVNLGGGAVLASLRLDNQPVKVSHGSHKKDTGLLKFGTIIGPQTQIGANAVIQPGVLIGRNCLIGPGAIIEKNLEDNSFFRVRQNFECKKKYCHFQSRFPRYL